MSVNATATEETFYNPEYFMQEDICRFCWSVNSYRCIFENLDESNTGLTSELHLKIKEVLGLELKNEKFINVPNRLCETCFSKINDFYDFKHFCCKSQSTLYEILENNIKGSSPFNGKLRSKHDYENNESTAVLSDSHLQSNCIDDLDCLLDAKAESPNEYSKIHEPPASKDVDYATSGSVKDGVGSETIFKCFGCAKSFKSSKSRGNHERMFCKALKTGYKCTICDLYLPSRRIYREHKRKHKNKLTVDLPLNVFKCKKCLENFQSTEELKSHMTTHNEEKKKRYVCETCGRSFNRHDYLNRHRLTHTGEKPHQCPHCDHRASQSNSLVVHMRLHTGERPYACDLCPLRCVSISNLRAHRRRHTEPPQYQCQICPKKFGYKYSLKSHIETIHEKSRTRDIVCGICGASYLRVRGLRQHMLAKHGGDKPDDVFQRDVNRKSEPD